jgi:hypothetical protein
MFRVQTELPCGAMSVGIEKTEEESATKVFDSFVRQIAAFPKDYVADVILSEDGVELKREHIHNAA